MKKYLLPKDGQFYKANLHCHTVLSDGTKTPEEVKALYQKLGYAIVAYTDHDILIPHDDLTDDAFLALHGFEMEVNEAKEAPFNQIKTCHMCFIGLDPENITQPCWHRSKYLFRNAVNYRDAVKFDENEPDFERAYTPERINEYVRIAREKGFFVTYNHPEWSKERYPEYIQYDGMHAFEMFNGGCLSNGYDDYNPRVYDDLLSAGKKIYCVAGDDNHNGRPDDSPYSESGWAFTVIKAEKLDYRTVTKALEDGAFYASEGPEIHELWVEDGKVHIKCSAAERVFCTYGMRFGGIYLSENGVPVTEASFPVSAERGYFRITVVDAHGKHACTNAYFPEDLGL